VTCLSCAGLDGRDNPQRRVSVREPVLITCQLHIETLDTKSSQASGVRDRLTLPADVATEAVRTTLVDGQLTVTLPRRTPPPTHLARLPAGALVNFRGQLPGWPHPASSGTCDDLGIHRAAKPSAPPAWRRRRALPRATSSASPLPRSVWPTSPDPSVWPNLSIRCHARHALRDMRPRHAVRGKVTKIRL
jgi:hypothetical protein